MPVTPHDQYRTTVRVARCLAGMAGAWTPTPAVESVPARCRKDSSRCHSQPPGLLIGSSVGRVVWTRRMRQPASAWDEVAAPPAQAAIGVDPDWRVWRHSLSRLWVPHTSFRSASQAARPRRGSRRAPCSSLSGDRLGVVALHRALAGAQEAAVGVGGVGGRLGVGRLVAWSGLELPRWPGPWPWRRRWRRPAARSAAGAQPPRPRAGPWPAAAAPAARPCRPAPGAARRRARSRARGRRAGRPRRPAAGSQQPPSRACRGCGWPARRRCRPAWSRPAPPSPPEPCRRRRTAARTRPGTRPAPAGGGRGSGRWSRGRAPGWRQGPARRGPPGAGRGRPAGSCRQWPILLVHGLRTKCADSYASTPSHHHRRRTPPTPRPATAGASPTRSQPRAAAAEPDRPPPGRRSPPRPPPPRRP
jgi:hypothetical protein